MRLAVAEGDAARAVDQRHGERIGRRAGRDEEDGDLALEDFGEPPLDRLVEIACAVGRREAGRGLRKGLADHGVGAGPVVGGKVHSLKSVSDIHADVTAPHARVTARGAGAAGGFAQ